MNIQDNVKTLLQNKPELRDHSGELACQYKYIYLRDLDFETFVYEKFESKITRVSARLQRQFPELRGKKWGERQTYSRVVAQKMRSQEKHEIIGPEEVDLNTIIMIDRRPLWKRFLGIN